MQDVSMHDVYIRTEKWPSKTETAQDISREVGVPALQLIEWAEQGLCPHFRINGGIPLFRTADVKRWMLAAQVVEECVGVAEASSFTLRIINNQPHIHDLPTELKSVGKVFDVNKYLLPSGVYFLYLRGELQYVGQSIEPSIRLAQHRNAGKMYDRAFLVPCPGFLMDKFEGALIRHFRPPLNGNMSPRGTCPDRDTLEELGIIEKILEESNKEEFSVDS